MSIGLRVTAKFPPWVCSIFLTCAILSCVLTTTSGSAHTNSTYSAQLIFRSPGTPNGSVVNDDAMNEVALGEEIVLSFLKHFIGPEKLKKSTYHKASFYENLKRLVKSVEDLIGQNAAPVDRKTYSVVTEIAISSPTAKPDTEMDGKETGRGKMTDMMFSPYMLIPQLIVLGFSPIVLANLKMFVMQTFMMNQMAFSAALWMTIRNMVFGPSPETPVKYYNFGYETPSNKHQHHDHHDHHAHYNRKRSIHRRRSDTLK